MENIEIVAVLEELADLLEIKGSNPFRIRAYRNAVRTIKGLTRGLSEMVEAGEDLTELPSVGKDMASHIVELVTTGELARLQEVAQEVPRSLVQLVKLDGVGPKKVKKLWEELDVITMDDLERELATGRVEALDGFGRTSVAKISQAIESYRRNVGRFRLDTVDTLIRGLLKHMRKAPGADRVEVAGSYRRRKETVGDVDILVQAEGSGAAVVEHFTAFESVERIVAAGDTKGSVVLRSGLEVDLRVIPAESFGAAMHYFTGSKEHNVKVRQLAQRRGLRVNEWGVFRVQGNADESAVGKDAGERMGGATEEEIFAAVELPWIPPVLREDRGEVAFEEGGGLPRLIEIDEIRGDLHMHSTWSDGKQSIEEMALCCKSRGYEYFVISDHSPALSMVGGLTAERAREQWSEVDELNERMEGITILKGMEVDILRDGALDMDDDILADLDLVLISIHSLMDMDKTKMTDRVLRAMEHPAVDILAHPTGRLLGKRDAFALDVEAVLQAARELDVAVEINANPIRLDLNDIHVHRARELGVPVAINTDAHNMRGLEYMSYGVDQGRRGWLGPEHILNTRSLEELSTWLGRRTGESRA
jgi:DNA polymerase (family X)